MVRISKKSVFKISIFELPRLENCMSRLCALDPLGAPPPPTQIGSKTHKEGLKHALHSIFHHCKWSQYQKNVLQNFPLLTFGGWKTAFVQFVHTPNAIEPPTNSNFEAFGGPMDRAIWAQWPLHGSPWVLNDPYCHQMITQTHPSGDRRVLEKVEFWKSCRCH